MLHAVTSGSGPDVVLLHGWGMHSALVRDLAERLAARFRVTQIDLPGHGRSPVTADLSLAGMADSLLAQAPERAHWIGWSLGSMVALRAGAMAPPRLRSVTLLAGTPRFVAGAEWPGVDESLLLRVAEDLKRDYRHCLQRFLGLQVWGMADGRPLLRALSARAAESPPPAVAGLEAGLSILRSADERGALAALAAPVLAILGRRDRLVPVAAGATMRRWCPLLELHIVEGATHLPFWTHHSEVSGVVENFLLRADG